MGMFEYVLGCIMMHVFPSFTEGHRRVCAYRHFALWRQRQKKFALNWCILCFLIFVLSLSPSHFCCCHHNHCLSCFLERNDEKNGNAITCTATNARKYDFNLVFCARTNDWQRQERSESCALTSLFPKILVPIFPTHFSVFIYYLFISIIFARWVRRFSLFVGSKKWINVGFQFYCTRFMRVRRKSSVRANAPRASTICTRTVSQCVPHPHAATHR